MEHALRLRTIECCREAAGNWRLAACAPQSRGKVRDCETQWPTRETRALPGLLRAERFYRIDQRGTISGEKTGDQSSQSENRQSRAKQERIVFRSLIELGMDQSSHCQRGGDADDESEHDRPHSLPHDQTQDVTGLGTQRHANSDLAG